MKEESLAIYRRYSPGFTQVEGSYFMGSCPFCGGDEFIAGIKDAVTEGTTERFICLGCDESGIPEDLVEALEGNQSTRQHGIEMSQFETPDKPGLERTKGSKGEESSKDEDKVFSLTRKQMRKLLDLAKEDYPSQVYRLLVWLIFLKGGLTARQLSILTKIPLSSVYRTLKENSIFYSIGKPRRFYSDLDDSHQQEKPEG